MRTAVAPPSVARSVAASFRSRAGPERVGRAVLALEDDRRRGVAPDLARLWADADPGRSPGSLAALVKADIRCRYARGEGPAIAEYLERFPALADEHDRVVSLVYEEFCLREERGERIDPERFCDRYAPWRDSLISQLGYHRLLSQVVAPPSAPPRFPALGETFQGYRLREVLGQGGVARVYLAHEEEVGDREVALKVSPDRGKEPSIQGRLDHAHIVAVLSVTPRDPETGLRGLCMPYRAGLPLDELIRRLDPSSTPRRAWAVWDAIIPRAMAERRQAPSTPGWQGFPIQGTYAQAVAWVVAVMARALEHAHARGILHRDVKPANVLLTVRDGPQLLDFNLAHDPHAVEQAEAALRGGTLPYMAPEQLEAFLDPGRWEGVAATADLYALGLLLRELLTGRRPEAPDPDLPLPRAIRELLDRRIGPPPSTRALNPTVPHALDAIIARCLAYAPADRYPSAGALAEDLERFLARRTLRYAKNPSKVEVARNWARRHRAKVVLAGMATLALGFLPMARDQFRPFEARLATRPAFLELKEGRFREARRQFVPLVRAYPEMAFTHAGLGMAEENLGNPGAASREFSHALKRKGVEGAFTNLLDDFSQSAFLHVYLGLVYEKSDQPRAAVGQYDAAVFCNPLKAEAAFEGAAREDPGSAFVRVGLGWVAAANGHWDKAKQAYQDALKIEPELYQAHQGLANVEQAGFDHVPECYQHLAIAIRQALRRDPKVDPGKIARLYHSRASALIDLAGKEHAAPGLAWGYYRAAMADLDQARARWDALDMDLRSDIEFTQARAEKCLGDLAADGSDERLSAYRRADKSIREAFRIQPGKTFYRPLRDEIAEKFDKAGAGRPVRAGPDGRAE